MTRASRKNWRFLVAHGGSGSDRDLETGRLEPIVGFERPCHPPLPEASKAASAPVRPGGPVSEGRLEHWRGKRPKGLFMGPCSGHFFLLW